MDHARALFCAIALGFSTVGLLVAVVPPLLAALAPSPFAFPVAFLGALIVLLAAVALVLACARRTGSS